MKNLTVWQVILWVSQESSSIKIVVLHSGGWWVFEAKFEWP